jgi:transposase
VPIRTVAEMKAMFIEHAIQFSWLPEMFFEIGEAVKAHYESQRTNPASVWTRSLRLTSTLSSTRTQSRRIATRYEKRATNYLAMITIAMVMLWL